MRNGIALFAFHNPRIEKIKIQYLKMTLHCLLIHARIYNYNGTSWNQLGNDIEGESVGDHFGVSVSISSNGNILAYHLFPILMNKK